MASPNTEKRRIVDSLVVGSSRSNTRSTPSDSFTHPRDTTKIYRTFYTLADANEYANRIHKDTVMPVYAVDKAEGKTSGSKFFVVASYNRLWERYSEMPPKSRCFYETILPELPCHFHVDAEYPKLNNPDADEMWLDDTFKDECIALMMEMGYVFSKDDVNIWTLVSSNEKKVSRHYIIKMFSEKSGDFSDDPSRGVVPLHFKNNYHCGAFARRLRNRLLDRYGPLPDNPFFLWGEKETDTSKYIPGKSNKKCYMDLAIYTKRRQFRLYFSTKVAGDYRPLLLEHEHILTQNYTKPIPPSVLLDKETFYSCFIQRVPSGSRECICLEVDGSEPVSTSNEKIYLSGIGMKPFGPNTKRSPTFPVETTKHDLTYHSDMNRVGKDGKVPQICSAIKGLIESVVNGSGRVQVKGFIETPVDGMLVLYSTTSRVCLINKLQTGSSEHSKNCVYYVASIREKQYWQKCFHDHGPLHQRTDRFPFPKRYADMVDKYYEAKSNLFKEEDVVDSFMSMFSQQQ
jgi:hypothetical protein